MSDTLRADKREPAERELRYTPGCCADAPHGHRPLYSYELRDRKIAQTCPHAGGAQ